MKVLHLVASGQRRGAELFASGLIQALQRSGVDQRVAILRCDGTAGLYPVPRTALKASLDRRPLDLRAAQALRNIVRAWQPEVVQLHGGEPLKYAAAAGLSSLSIIVYRRIGCAPPGLRRRTRRLVYGSLMRWADKTVVVAEALRSEAMDLFGVPDTKLTVIPNGVDMGRMTPSSRRDEMRQALGLPAHASVVLSLGALTWEKDPLAQLDAAARVLREDEMTFLVIAGDGPMRSEVREAVLRLTVADRIRILGSRSDVADLLSASDVLVFASRPDGMEGMPASLIEAGMCGVPVVGFDVAGASEVVVDGETGFLVSWGDTARLAQRLTQVIRDAALGTSMGEAARARCRSMFDLEVLAQRYLQLYEELVTRQPTARSRSAKKAS